MNNNCNKLFFMKDYILILDVNSLYPNTIISHNISPDSLHGYISNVDIENQKEYLMQLFDIKDDLDKQFFNNYARERFPGRIFAALLFSKQYDEIYKHKFEVSFANESKVFTGEELINYLDKNEIIVAGNGALFVSNRIGIIPSKEKELLLNRDKYKAILKKDPNNKEADIKQLAVKILANSVYGILGTSKFIYYNVYLAEAITISGQYISFFLTSYFKNLLNGNDKIDFNIDALRVGKSYYSELQPYVLYRDTDSLFIKVSEDKLSIPFEEKVAQIGKEILINTSLQFVKKNRDLLLENSPKVKTEFIGDCGLFTSSKKRYFIYDTKKDKYKLAGFESSGNSKLQNQLLIETLKDIVTGKVTKQNKDLYLHKLKQNIVQKVTELKDQLIENELSDNNDIFGKVKLNAEFPALNIQDFFKQFDNIKALEAAIKSTNVNVRAAIIYNTLMQTDKFKTGTKGLSIKGNLNNKAITKLSSMVDGIFKSLIPQFCKINVIVFDDVKFLVEYVNLDVTVKQLSDKIYKNIAQQLFEEDIFV